MGLAMTAIVGATVIGFVIGMLVGVAIAYPRGWKAGTTWAQARIFGH